MHFNNPIIFSSTRLQRISSLMNRSRNNPNVFLEYSPSAVDANCMCSALSVTVGYAPMRAGAIYRTIRLLISDDESRGNRSSSGRTYTFAALVGCCVTREASKYLDSGQGDNISLSRGFTVYLIPKWVSNPTLLRHLVVPTR
jgi:hypothetical protein